MHPDLMLEPFRGTSEAYVTILTYVWFDIVAIKG